MEDTTRIIQPESIQIKLINGSTISVRPLTLKEKKECLKLLPAEGIPDDAVDVAEQYIKVQVDILHYIVTRSHPDFKKEEIEEQVDSSMIRKIFNLVFSDPFESLGG